MTNTNEIKNLVFTGQTLITSNKQGDYESDTKTVYINVDDSNAQKLTDFGITVYDSKDGERFIITRFSKRVAHYFGDDSQTLTDDVSINSDHNLRVDVPATYNLIRGFNKGNTFFRLQAIQTDTRESLEHIEPQNPFA